MYIEKLLKISFVQTDGQVIDRTSRILQGGELVQLWRICFCTMYYDMSRMKGDFHIRFCEKFEVKIPFTYSTGRTAANYCLLLDYHLSC